MPPKENDTYGATTTTPPTTKSKKEERDPINFCGLPRALNFWKHSTTSSTFLSTGSNDENDNDDNNDNTGNEQSSSSFPANLSDKGYQKGQTVVYHTDDGAPYVICNSSHEFVNPTTTTNDDDNNNKSYHETVNDNLNLNLGLSFLKCRSQLSSKTISIIECLDRLLLMWWEVVFFYIWSTLIPISTKRWINQIGWNIYCTLYTKFIGKGSGIHPLTSVEYHALTSVMWWAQFFTITPQRIRFSLGELHTISKCDMPESNRTEQIQVDMMNAVVHNNDNKNNNHSGLIIHPNDVPDQQRDHCHVRGTYIHCRPKNVSNESNNNNQNKKKKNEKKLVLFWIYGGAYLGGNVQSNLAVANEFSQDCDVDVFVPQFRLAPESTIDDVLWDICLAYLWFIRHVQSDYACADDDHDDHADVCLLGISSGGAIALRLLQLLAEQHEHQPPKDLVPSFLTPIVDKMTPQLGCIPKCALFFGPYIDYTLPKHGSFLHYAKHDLVVSEAVQDYGLPYLNDFIPPLEDDLVVNNDGPDDQTTNDNTSWEKPLNATGRKTYSPVHRSFYGLSSTSMCFVVSEHEVTYDMTIEAVNKARKEECDVTVAVWKYMCHTWPFLQTMIPEGRSAMEFAKHWLVQNY